MKRATLTIVIDMTDSEENLEGLEGLKESVANNEFGELFGADDTVTVTATLAVEDH